MTKDPVMVLAGKWFEKFNDPSTAIYNIAHARRLNSAPKFKPQEVVDQLRKTSDLRMRQLIDAAEELGTPQKKGVSEFLCKRGFGYSRGMRSSNWMVKRFSAAFQSRIGMVHFWLMLRSAR